MIFLLGANDDELDKSDSQATTNSAAGIHNTSNNYLNEANDLLFHDDDHNHGDFDRDEHGQLSFAGHESSADSCSEEYEDCESDDSCYIAMKSHQRRPPIKNTINRNLSTENPPRHHQQHHNSKQQPFSSTRKIVSSKENHNKNKNKNANRFEQRIHKQQHDINSSIISHYLTIEDLRSTINSCWLCGCDWSEEHVSLDCPECDGYSLSRPCPQCDGQCKQVWCRNLSATHDLHKAFWSGHCDLPGASEIEQRKQEISSQTNDEDKQHQANNKLASKQLNLKQQPASRQHYAVFCNV